jgi:hypothetical protein
MGTWVEYVPAGGWAAFARSAALTDALWDRLPAADWWYLNLVSDSSMWESRRDGSVVSAQYDGERLVHLAAGAGAAVEVAGPLAAEFGLVPTVAPDAEPGAAADRGRKAGPGR